MAYFVGLGDTQYRVEEDGRVLDGRGELAPESVYTTLNMERPVVGRVVPLATPPPPIQVEFTAASALGMMELKPTMSHAEFRKQEARDRMARARAVQKQRREAKKAASLVAKG